MGTHCHSYIQALRKSYKGLRHSQLSKYILLDGFLLCIQHFYRKLSYNMDLDIFLVYMQDAWGIQDQLCILVWVLFLKRV